MRLRTTLVLEYDADPEHYGTDDPQEMVKLDVENDLAALVCTADTMSWSVEKVEN